MKGFDSDAIDPRGQWYRKVRERVSQVERGMLETELVELLGEPDQIGDDPTNRSREFQELMENVAGGPTLIRYGDKRESDRIFRYRDPFRLRKWYVFAIRNGAVYSSCEETLAAGQTG